MKKSLLLLLPIMVTNAHAVYVDVRHEYLDDSKANYDRAYISHRFNNGFGFAIEAISKSGGDDTNKAFNDLEVQGNEYTASYQFKQGAVAWQPGFVLETGSGYSTYKPYLRATWTLNDSWWLGARYRFEYVRRSGASDTREDDKTNRMDVWAGYKWGNFDWVVEGIYKKAEKYDLYDGGKDNYEYNFRTAYLIDAWSPFVEVGNVSVNNTSDDRQTRFRVGIGYTF
ncbi:oligogalacturonide-rhamnogalacturonide-specific porin [Buttiauxella gaviniae ATCC 51604]|uniref:Oligogalacturonide-rhamnogalacturonide-specific porin n=2 Tax=Buttiauxella gaviniae TaxID=82990 RepID=A0A1B7I0W6_9ENTR|nr:oligogalacturonide-rhamnogalacturonide-specific porin [Buttiauxella gaviniae ATCC 51604]